MMAVKLGKAHECPSIKYCTCRCEKRNDSPPVQNLDLASIVVEKKLLDDHLAHPKVQAIII